MFEPDDLISSIPDELPTHAMKSFYGDGHLCGVEIPQLTTTDADEQEIHCSPLYAHIRGTEQHDQLMDVYWEMCDRYDPYLLVKEYTCEPTMDIAHVLYIDDATPDHIKAYLKLFFDQVDAVGNMYYLPMDTTDALFDHLNNSPKEVREKSILTMMFTYDRGDDIFVQQVINLEYHTHKFDKIDNDQVSANVIYKVPSVMFKPGENFLNVDDPNHGKIQLTHLQIDANSMQKYLDNQSVIPLGWVKNLADIDESVAMRKYWFEHPFTFTEPE